MIVVSDSTPLIFLAKLSDYHLLETLYHKVHIPQEVYSEVIIAGKGRPGEKELIKAKGDWIEVRTILNQKVIKELQDSQGLGKGEAAAMILAQELQANLLLTDDGLARRIALKFFQGTSTMISGTIGVLKLSKQKDIISKSQLKSKIEYLRQEGFYLSDTVYQQILKDIEED